MERLFFDNNMKTSVSLVILALLASALGVTIADTSYSGIRLTVPKTTVHEELKEFVKTAALLTASATWPTVKSSAGSSIFSYSFEVSGAACSASNYNASLMSRRLDIADNSFILSETGPGLTYSFTASWDFMCMGIHMLFGSLSFDLVSSFVKITLPYEGQKTKTPTVVMNWTTLSYDVSGGWPFSSMVSAWIAYLFEPAFLPVLTTAFTKNIASQSDLFMSNIVHMDNNLSDTLKVGFENSFMKVVESPTGSITLGLWTNLTTANGLNMQLPKVFTSDITLGTGNYQYCVANSLLAAMAETSGKSGLYSYHINPTVLGMMGIVYDLEGIMPKIDLLYDGRAAIEIVCEALPDASIMMLANNGLTDVQTRLQMAVRCTFSHIVAQKTLLSVLFPIRSIYVRTVTTENKVTTISGKITANTLYNVAVLSSVAPVEGDDTLLSVGQKVAALVEGMTLPANGWKMAVPAESPNMVATSLNYDQTCITYGA